MKKKYLALFDLDNTILDTDSGRLFVTYSYKKKRMSFGELLWAYCLGFSYKTGLLDAETVIRKWAVKYRGICEKDIIEFSNIWFNEDVIGHIRIGAKKAIDDHNANGGKTVILSAASPYICKPIMEYLEMDDYICTLPELIEGKFTGKLSGPYCYGPEKLFRVEKYISTNGFQLSDSYYYADSFSDHYVFEKVSNPVCVNPQKKLAQKASQHSWEIVKW